MKKYGLFIVGFFLFVLIVTVGAGAATVKTSKHDLSMPVASGGTGPGPIQSAAVGGTKEVCVFCHTPHSAADITGTQAPLWNKNIFKDPDPAYTVYSSDVLNALSYPAAETPVRISGGGKAVHILNTRLCLSCHDGTIALGQLANVPSGLSGDIQMVGVAADNTMPTTAAGYIGIRLDDDHPVAIRYVRANPPGGDMELMSLPLVGNVKVLTEGGNNYVECTSCHNAHDNTYGKFLVETNRNSTLCEKCHSKTGFTTNSAHADNTIVVSYAPPTGGTPANHGPRVGDVRCMNCHFPHKAGVNDTQKTTPVPAQGKYLLSFKEEQSCFNTNLDRWDTGLSNTACHGSGGSGKNIYTEVNKNSAHKVGDDTRIGRHEASEAQQAVAGGWSIGKWHVECQDCHNPHTAGSVNHIPQRGTMLGNTVTATTSPLYGTGGVSVLADPTWPPAALPGTYSPIQPAGVTNNTTTSVLYEYEICFKCHTDFAWGMTPETSPTMGLPMTNQALEFNTTATGPSISYHPVVQNTNAALHQTPPQGTLSLAPTDWNTNKGNQTMYCSDCHTKEGDALPTGPHGSSTVPSGYIVSYYFDDNPGTPGGGQQSPFDLCLQCHDPATYLTPSLAGPPGTGFKTVGGLNLHASHAWRAQGPAFTMTQIANPISYKCVNCHTRVPHGWWRRGMVIVQGEGAIYGQQYEAVGGGYITNLIMPAAPGGYTYPGGVGPNLNNNCTAGLGCHI